MYAPSSPAAAPPRAVYALLLSLLPFFPSSPPCLSMRGCYAVILLLALFQSAYARRLFQRVPPGVPTSVTSSMHQSFAQQLVESASASLKEFVGIQEEHRRSRAVLRCAPVPVPVLVRATNVPYIRGPAGAYAGINGATRVWAEPIHYEDAYGL